MKRKSTSSFVVIKLFLILVAMLAVTIRAVDIAQNDFTQYVNPFIGTGGHGHTFPGAVFPFGMIQLSPDTREANWDGSSGYHYSDSKIYGFSHTHLSGTGIPDGCDVLLTPIMGEIMPAELGADAIEGNFASEFSHSAESASPGYYSVFLSKYSINAELTATPRVGLHRYTFQKSGKAHIILDLDWRDKLVGSDLKIIGNNKIEGYRQSSSWAKDQRVYFVIEFSRPFNDVLTNKSNSLKPGKHREVQIREDKKIALGFDVRENDNIVLKVAISYTDQDGARKNLEAEAPGWDFDQIRENARRAWNKELGKIEVEGGTRDEKVIFYTALYHTMIHPSIISDVDGRFRGYDGKIHRLDTRRMANRYTVFSLWDTFRATHPLYTIIDQKRTSDYVNTFLDIYKESGRLPVWELWGNETDTMIGFHSVSVIADAMAKGISGFDYSLAYKAAKESAESDRFGLKAYRTKGFISSEDENESVSKTLEYAYDDWCLAKMAAVMSKIYPTSAEYKSDYEKYSRRAASFLNLFDPTTGFFRPRKNGGFIEPFAPSDVSFHFTEANSWQYTFFVPHYPALLIDLMGGRAKFTHRLTELFTTDAKLTGRVQPDITGLIGQYAHGNEPSHHIPYLFNYAGRHDLTAKYVRLIMQDFYRNAPDGLIGNEDCGQMSAWYVMSSIGLYPVAPGRPYYEIGSPLFTKIKIHLENAKVFTIIANNQTKDSQFVKSVYVNNKQLERPQITHSQLLSGATLIFNMSSEPSNGFSQPSQSETAPESMAAPVLNANRVFTKEQKVLITSAIPSANIYYTLDGTMPDTHSSRYIRPFTINQDTVVSAIAISRTGVKSPVVKGYFFLKKNDWKVVYTSDFSREYTGGGPEALIDGQFGTANFASGEWQGYRGIPFEAIIDLGERKTLSELGASFLQSVRSWIWMPKSIEFFVSDDGQAFTKVLAIEPRFPLDDYAPATRQFIMPIQPQTARFIKIRAENIGKIPDWHPGRGEDPWIFVDEVLIRTK